MAAFLFFSCEKYSGDDETDDNNKEANSTLVVRTRTVETDGKDATISYPVNIYVFNSDNTTCVDVTTIESADNPVSLKLPEGSYNVYAIAGADAANYDLPTKENATTETVISLKSGKSHGDIMTATNNVTLTYGEENTLTLSLNRKVMLIETVTINNVPSNVTAVSIEINPLYKSLLLNGEYSTETVGAQKIDLTKEADGNTWKNACNTYLLEASGKATIKVLLTTAGGTKSYSYSSSEELKANHKINITGTYTETGIEINGTIKGVTWGVPVNITFSFDGNGNTTEENPDGDDGNGDGGNEASGNAPAAGTLYKDCYVLKSEPTGNGTVVTLMSTGYKDDWSFEVGNQESIKSEIDAGIAALSVDGISGWRLPTFEELEYIKDNIQEISKNLTDNNRYNFPPSFYYFFLTKDNKISSVYLSTGSTMEPGKGKSFILRAFTTITFTE